MYPPQPIQSPRGYLPDQSAYPFKGLQTNAPSTMIDPSGSPLCQNISMTDGDLVKRFGYVKLGGTLVDGLPVMATVDFEREDGVHFLVAITTEHEYVYNPVTNTWGDITVQNLVGESWDDSSISADTWSTITGSWLTQATSTSVPRTGTQENQISWVVAAGIDTIITVKDAFGDIALQSVGPWLIFTNGVDTPRYWDGYISNFNVVSWNYPFFTTCKWLGYFNGHLLMGFPQGLNNTVFPPIAQGGLQNLAWSNAATVNEWLAGTAGEVSLFDIDGSIQALVQFQGQYFAIYGDNSIHLMSYVGGAQIFVFQKVMSQTSLVSPLGIADLGYNHVFMSEENLFVFDGSTRITPVGDIIHTTYRDQLASQYRYAAFCQVDKPRRRAFFFLPTGLNTGVAYQLDYNLAGFLLDPKSWIWSTHVYDQPITCYGTTTQGSTGTWALLSGDWSSQTQVWGISPTGITNFPARCHGDSNGNVYLANSSVLNDSGSSINAFWDSMDYTIPQEYQSEFARWSEIEFELSGTQIDISYSIDRGNTYIPLTTNMSLSLNWSTYKLFLDVVSKTLRVRIANNYTNGLISLRWLKCWFKPAGVR